MEEIKTIHSLDIEWGCITNMLDRICTIESQIEGGWKELIDMVMDAVTEEGERKDPATAFFHLYRFLFGLYYRIKANPERKPFNRYSYDEMRHNFMIHNYDYNTFLWALDHGFSKDMNGDFILIAEDKLTDKQVAALKRRCK